MMRKFCQRLLMVGAFGVVSLAACVGIYYFTHRPPIDVREFGVIQYEWQSVGKETPQENAERGRRCLEVAKKYPDQLGGLAALILTAVRSPRSEAGKEALENLGPYFETTDLSRLAKAFDYGLQGNHRALAPHAPILLDRARQSLRHPKSPRLLAIVCTATKVEENETPPPIFTEAADMIVSEYADSPDIANFAFCLNNGAPWTLAFERHLRAILKANHDRFVLCATKFALATVVQGASEERQTEAEKLLEEFLAEYDGVFDYHGIYIEQGLRVQAQMQLAEIRANGLGKPAMEISGVDLNDEPMTLSEHRGKVVVLNFWATWCFPCMKLIPHEVELTQAFADEPFEMVGINSDKDVEKARSAVERTHMSWRSFRDIRDGQATISNKWKVLGYPSVYLIDHHGVIRRHWVGYPPTDELHRMIRVLVGAARCNVALDSMAPVVAELRNLVEQPSVQQDQIAPSSSTNSNFLERTIRNPDGTDSKYALFVPASYNGTTPYPAIVALHGAGSRGDDGQSQIRYGLAKGIRERTEEFPFITIFPQAREFENFTITSKGGKRVLAILDLVQREYRIDPDRVILTGVSMGGEGTWSLAGAEPNRWAAIVPVCHGGDIRVASQIKEIPCWCFHGAADKVIPPQQSRDMIQALQAAGGHPLYQEFLGVGHNDCADRVYSMKELIDWMAEQNRSRRD